MLYHVTVRFKQFCMNKNYFKLDRMHTVIVRLYYQNWLVMFKSKNYIIHTDVLNILGVLKNTVTVRTTVIMSGKEPDNFKEKIRKLLGINKPSTPLTISRTQTKEIIFTPELLKVINMLRFCLFFRTLSELFIMYTVLWWYTSKSFLLNMY